MKNAFWIFTLLFALAACGKQEPVEPAEPAPAAEEQAVEEAADPAEEEVAGTESETQVVVEESAAEPAADEQAILLAKTDAPEATGSWQFDEGKHYTRMVPSQPTVGGADKIEVAEFFWYGCPHCFDFEPAIDRWDANKPANVRFVRIPITWNNIAMLHARVYYAADVLARNGTLKDGPGFHMTVFEEFHNRGNRLTTEASIRRLFERFGVGEEDFDRTWKSFEVDQKLRVAQDLQRRYSVSSVPAIVVNGKYRTGGQEAGGYGKLIELIDELVARESLR